jgi:hypothetical protein
MCHGEKEQTSHRAASGDTLQVLPSPFPALRIRYHSFLCRILILFQRWTKIDDAGDKNICSAGGTENRTQIGTDAVVKEYHNVTCYHYTMPPRLIHCSTVDKNYLN